MTANSILSIAAFVAVGIAGAAVAAPRATASTPSSALEPSQDRYKEFKDKFKQAQSIGSFDEMNRLVKQYEDEAIRHVELLSQAMATHNSDDIEQEFQALAKAWKNVYKLDFAGKTYVYQSELAFDRQRRDERRKLLDRYDVARNKMRDNEAGARSGPEFEMSGGEFAELAKGLVEVGDYYYAAQASSAAAGCFDETLRGKEADFRRACEWWGKSVEYYDKVELNNARYHACKQRFDTLLAQGYGPTGATDPNGPTPGTPTAPTPTANATPVVAATNFEMVTDVGDFVRPDFYNDEIYQLWPRLWLKTVKSATSMDWISKESEKGPSFIRTGSAQIGIDSDRDGAAEKTVGVTGNFAPVEAEVGAGDSKRRWGMVFKTGIQEDFFNGLRTNLQGDDNVLPLYVHSAASVVGDINGVRVRVLDDNMDCVFGSAPRGWNYPGMSPDILHQLVDSIVIGDSKRARPWSQYQEVGGAWYELESDRGGLAIKATPATLDIGTLRLDYKGPVQPTWLVVKGQGKLENCYYDLVTADKKPARVPAGSYALFVGELRSGKKQQTLKALITTGSNAPTIVVRAGEESVLKLGAPYHFEFATEADGEEKIKVLGASVAIVGSAGERYERAWNCSPRPEVSVRKAGAKKGGKPERMDVVSNLEEVDENGKYKFLADDTWRPLDTSFEIKKGEKVEVQLVEKKNKLFGEISSDWK